MSKKVINYLKEVFECEDISKKENVVKRLNESQLFFLYEQLDSIKQRINFVLENSTTEDSKFFLLERYGKSSGHKVHMDIQGQSEKKSKVDLNAVVQSDNHDEMIVDVLKKKIENVSCSQEKDDLVSKIAKYISIAEDTSSDSENMSDFKTSMEGLLVKAKNIDFQPRLV
jgi:hypothetical protein